MEVLFRVQFNVSSDKTSTLVRLLNAVVSPSHAEVFGSNDFFVSAAVIIQENKLCEFRSMLEVAGAEGLTIIKSEI